MMMVRRKEGMTRWRIAEKLVKVTLEIKERFERRMEETEDKLEK